MFDGLRVQVVVAHPDDETFGCGSLLLHAAAAGAATAVCCATRGEAGQVAPGVTVPPGGVGELRETELREAAALLGVGQVELLGFTDSDMSGPVGTDTLVGADPAAVRTAIADAVEGFAPDALVTLDGSDGHRDHVRVRDLTVEIGSSLGLPVYLACLPRSLMRRWAEHMRELDPGSAYLAVAELGTPDEELTTVLDTSGHLDARWRAIRAHRSQSSPFDALPDGLAREFLGSEHLVRVEPRWSVPAR
jgi:LmbE family N-acetylglucosaminyl deacetylase